MSYARFTIDVSSLLVDEVHVGVGYDSLQNFLSFWREYGVFVALGQDLMLLQSKVPLEIRKQLDAVIKHMHIYVNRFERHSSVDIGTVLADVANGTFDTLDRAKLELIGITSDLYEELNKNPSRLSFYLRPTREEICRITNLHLSETKRRLDDLRSTDVETDVPAPQVWKSKLRPIFVANNLVTVIDQYALFNFARASEPRDVGLGFLINQLVAEKGKLAAVDIHTASRNLSDADAAIKKLAEFSRSIGVKNLNIYIASQEVAQDIMHDRSVIGVDHTIDIGSGLELLDAAPRKRSVSYAFKKMTPERSHSFHRLRNACRNMKTLRF